MVIPARFFGSVSELRAWFEAHHADRSELWVGFYKAHTGRGGVVYPEAVDEALCFGWIDTTVRRIDEDRYANRFVPRRPGSQWSEGNRRRYLELNREGKVDEAGRRAFARRPRHARPQFTSGRGYRLSPEFAARLRARPSANRFFRSRPRGYRKRATFWVMSAVASETRDRRFSALLTASDAGTIPHALLLPGEVAPRPHVGGNSTVRARPPLHRQKGSGSR